MEIRYSPKFIKKYQKLPPKFRAQFDSRFLLFVSDPTAPVLRLHPLKGKYRGYWSISVSGDLRAIYLERGEEIIIFAFIGTHSQLYG